MLNADHTTREVDMMEWTLRPTSISAPDVDPNRVGDDEIGQWRVSTVFIGIDMTPSFAPADAPPSIFETMVFGPDDVAVIGRPSTWADAEALHALTVNKLREQKGQG